MFTPDTSPDRVNVFIKYPDSEQLATGEMLSGEFGPLPERHFKQWQLLLESLPANKLSGKLTVRPVFTSVSLKEIEALKAIAVRRAELEQQRYQPPRFENYVWISYAAGLCAADERGAELDMAADFLLKRVATWEGIEAAYQRLDDVSPALKPSVHPISFAAPRTDPEQREQIYLEDAPRGLSARAMWNVDGGQGEGVRFIDIERGWNLSHPDLLDDIGVPRVTFNSSNNGVPSTLDVDEAHGTHVLGIVCASHNSINIIGMAPALQSREVMSYLSPTQATNTADAIMRAAANQLKTLIKKKVDSLRGSGANVVLLIEAEARLSKQQYYFPVEVYEETFKVIELAVGAGITVIEPAGNGQAEVGSATAPLQSALDIDNLEAFLLPAGQQLSRLKSLARDPAQRSRAGGAGISLLPFADSRAIMVGQAVGTTGATFENGQQTVAWTRHPRSNYGSRIDCFASGTAVRTLDRLAGSLADFGGTSAASAVIAAAACCTQGVAIAHLGAALSPALLRRALSDSACGTDSKGEKIGVMPDLMRVAKTHIGSA